VANALHLTNLHFAALQSMSHIVAELNRSDTGSRAVLQRSLSILLYDLFRKVGGLFFPQRLLHSRLHAMVVFEHCHVWF